MRSPEKFSCIVVGLTLVLASFPAHAAETSNQWEQGEDPVFLGSGLHSGDLFVRCSQGSGMVFVSAAAADGHALSIQAGAVSGVSHEHAAQDGRSREWFDLKDPVWQAAMAEGALTVDSTAHPLATERDKRFFGLFLRICTPH
jgi:hypothetical protein